MKKLIVYFIRKSIIVALLSTLAAIVVWAVGYLTVEMHNFLGGGLWADLTAFTFAGGMICGLTYIAASYEENSKKQSQERKKKCG